MSGKWPIFAVLGLGLVASLCAAVLMAAMRSSGSEVEAAPTTVEILVASSDVPGMTRIEDGVFEMREVLIADKPDGAFTDQVQVLGKLLKTGLVSGQPLVESLLLKDEGGAQLASSLPSGMRAVSVEINGSSAMRGLLFPGCRVDVIVAYKVVASRNRADGPVSQTLLQNVSVLAVEDKTVFSVEPEAEEDGKPVMSPRRSGRGLMVTLMVDPQQARELQASLDIGELSLSLRNPLDASLTADPSAVAVDIAATESDNAVQEKVEAGPWRTVVIRGDKTEVMVFGEGTGVEGPGGAPDDGDAADRYADVPTEFDNEVE